MDFVEQTCARHQATIRELKEEEKEIRRKIDALYVQPEMTERMRDRAKAYTKEEVTTMRLLFPKFLLSYKMKYWSIKKLFIDPFNAYIDRLLEIDKRISELERQCMALRAEMSDEDVANYLKRKNTRVEVVIDYDVNPGDCGDCY